MRVLHVIASLSPVYGGPSGAVVEMCRALRAAGVDTEIAATNADGARNSSLADARKRAMPDPHPDSAHGVKTESTFHVPPPKQSVGGRPRSEAEGAGDGIPTHIFRRVPPYLYMTSPGMAAWLALHVREFDVVHVHALFSHPTTLGCLWARVHGVPYIIRPLGLLDPWCLNQNRLRKRLYWALADRVNLRNAAALHFTSDAEAREALWVPPSMRRAVIPLGAPVLGCSWFDKPFGKLRTLSGPESVEGLTTSGNKTARPEPVEGRPGMGHEDVNGKKVAVPDHVSFLRKHGVPKGHKVLLFLSRINPKKGLDLLAPALGEIKKQGDRFVLLIAGPDEDGYRARVEEMLAKAGVAGDVRFLGLVGGRDKESLFAHSDLFVLPSYQENFAIAAVEAMQRGLPVVISDRVGIHSTVTRWKAGAVVKCSVDDLAGTLHGLLAHPEKLKEMGRNGIRLVESEFSWHDAARRIKLLYQEIIRQWGQVLT